MIRVLLSASLCMAPLVQAAENTDSGTQEASLTASSDFQLLDFSPFHSFLYNTTQGGSGWVNPVILNRLVQQEALGYDSEMILKMGLLTLGKKYAEDAELQTAIATLRAEMLTPATPTLQQSLQVLHRWLQAQVATPFVSRYD